MARGSRTIHAPASKRLRRIVRVGTDFSGLDVVVYILARLGIDFEHVFSCDSRKVARKFVQAEHTPKIFYDDIRSRDNSQTPSVDLYVWGPPCQSFSTAGRRGGIDDARGQLWVFALDYIVRRKPACVVFENVASLASEHRGVLTSIIRTLRDVGYHVKWSVLNTLDFGLPQRRLRVYLLAVFKDIRHVALELPQPVPVAMPFHVVVPPLPRETWRALPGRRDLAKKVSILLEKAMSKHPGLNPFTTPVCFSIGSTAAWSSFAVGHVPTLTKGHCESGVYWCSTKGGFLDVDDLLRLQGLPTGVIDFVGSGLTPRIFAGMLGNAMSGNVLEFVLPKVLSAGGFLSEGEVERMRAASVARYSGAQRR